MERLQGVVEDVRDFDGDIAVKVDGIWFKNKFKTLPSNVVSGAFVAVDYKPSSYKTKFWSKIDVTDNSSGGVTNGSVGSKQTVREEFPVPYNNRGRSIARQNALTNAVTTSNLITVSNKKGVDDVDTYTDMVLEIAAKYERYTCGDMDVEIKKEIEDELEREMG